MNGQSEFIVNGVVTGVSGTYHIIGRCGDSPIRVGDMFQQIEFQSESPRTVQVIVDRIQAYQRPFDELGPGMTGTLNVHGAGVEFIQPNSVLLGNSAATHDQNDQLTSQSATTHA